tara:strand:+ start:113 stop:604 length:492 start_codon:yes stop_codon:yes gene_type:complete
LTGDPPVGSAQIDIVPVSPFAPDAVYCLARYFDELDIRFDDGFERSSGAREGGEAYIPPDGVFLVAFGSGGPVGSGGITFRAGDFAEIRCMWVDPAARGRGLGRQILEALETVAVGAGHAIVRLDSNRALTEAHALYQRSGYTEIYRYNDNPYAHLWFEKLLG